eukprot:SM000352S13433  [mRNA]  locus=s352:51609:52263:+ [translate_table: standard]
MSGAWPQAFICSHLPNMDRGYRGLARKSHAPRLQHRRVIAGRLLGEVHSSRSGTHGNTGLEPICTLFIIVAVTSSGYCVLRQTPLDNGGGYLLPNTG